nr:hypothetical protein [uncultured Roseovarius sp.]
MKLHFNKRLEAGQLLGHRRIAVKDHYSWVADDPILEQWGKYLEATRAVRLADKTRRSTS